MLQHCQNRAIKAPKQKCQNNKALHIFVTTYFISLFSETGSHIAQAGPTSLYQGKLLEFLIPLFLPPRCQGLNPRLHFVFRSRVSLCNPGCTGTSFIDQVGLELTFLCLPGVGIKGERCQCSAQFYVFNVNIPSGHLYVVLYVVWTYFL